MTTAAELIEYLKCIPPETQIEVLVDNDPESFSSYQKLYLPGKKEDGTYDWSSYNVDYGGDDGNGVPFLQLG